MAEQAVVEQVSLMKAVPMLVTLVLGLPLAVATYPGSLGEGILVAAALFLVIGGITLYACTPRRFG